jgi:Protein of unknown function (DUF3224)
MSERIHATATIDVETYDPQPYDSTAGGPDLVEIHVTERFSGDIEGKGVVRFLQALRADGTATFVGIERVNGRIGDREGTFLLQDDGTADARTVRGTWFVVPRSGTGQLAGLRGEGGFVAETGKSAAVTLDYWFDPNGAAPE